MGASSEKPFALTTFGHVTDINHMSGTPYHLWRAARDVGWPMEAIDLPRSGDVPVARFLWQMGRVLRGAAPSGYMWSPSFQESVWRPRSATLARCHILHNFQLFAPSVIARAENGEAAISFYIDLTLRELFGGYRDLKHLKGSTAEAAFTLEARGYRAARRVITMSETSARVLRDAYGVDPEKVSVVHPGANVDETLADAAPPPAYSRGREFTVGFVGMDYRRKGLLPLAEAIMGLRRRKHRIRLLVIGPSPPELRGCDGIEMVGRIDKSSEMSRFIATLARCDLGALASEAEGVAISVLEFLRLGIPVLTTKVGGIAEAVPHGCAVLLEPGASASDLAAELERLLVSDDVIRSLQAEAWSARGRLSWRRAAMEMAQLFNVALPQPAASHHG